MATEVIIVTSIQQLDRLIDRTQRKIGQLSNEQRKKFYYRQRRGLLQLRARKELQDARASNNS